MLITILQFIVGIGMLQATLLGALLLVVPGPYKYISRLTGSVLLITAILMGSELMDLFDVKNSFRGLQFYSILIDLLLVVLVWQLTNFILGLKKAFEPRDLVHLLPFFVGLVWLQTGFQWYGNDMPGSFSHIPNAIGIFVVYKGIIWTLYMVRSIRNYRLYTDSGSTISSTLKKDLFAKLIWPFIFILTVTLVTFWMEFFGIQLPIDSDYMGVVLVVFYIYFLSFSILIDPKTFIRIRKGDSKAKYARSSLDPDQGAIYLYRMRSYLEKEKPYLERKLNLNELAEVIGLSTNQLSQLINEQLGQSFNDLMNEYRLEVFKEKLLDPSQSHKTMLALAFESGFQSKASFNRVFKKMEGISPSQYRQEMLSHPTQ